MSTRDRCIHGKSASGSIQCDQLHQSSSPIPAVGTTTVQHDLMPPPRSLRGCHRPRFHDAIPGYAPTRIVDAPGLAADLGLASVSVKDESKSPRAAVVQDPRRVVGGVPGARRPAGPRTGVAGPRRAAGRAGTARRAHAGCRDGRKPRSRGRVHGPAPRLPGAHLRSRRHRGGAHRRIESEGAPVTVVDGTYDDAVRASAALAADDVLVVSDTSWEGYTAVPLR